MTTTTAITDTYFETLAGDFESSYYTDLYYEQQAEAEYYQWEAQQAAAVAPVVPMYTDTLPAQPAALVPFAAEMFQSQDAITTTLSEMNLLVLNTADAETRSQLMKIAKQLICKAPMMDETKEGYRQMLEAAEANAAFYYCRPAVETPPAAPTPYKRKYDTAADIARHLATTSTRKEIASLYYVNAELIELTPTLKQAFNERKAKFYRSNTAAAA